MATKTFYEAAFGWSFTDFGPDYTAIGDAGLDGGFVSANMTATPMPLVDPQGRRPGGGLGPRRGERWRDHCSDLRVPRRPPLPLPRPRRQRARGLGGVMEAGDRQRDITRVGDAHAVLNDHLAAMTGGPGGDPTLPSLLPGWTRGHVLTHIARNADSFVRVLEAARSGRDRHPVRGRCRRPQRRHRGGCRARLERPRRRRSVIGGSVGRGVHVPGPVGSGYDEQLAGGGGAPRRPAVPPAGVRSWFITPTSVTRGTRRRAGLPTTSAKSCA